MEHIGHIRPRSNAVQTGCIAAQPAFLITWRGEVREPGGGKRREQSYLPNRLLHPSGRETRPLRFNAHQTFLLEQTSPPPMFFTSHESRVTNHGLYVFHESRDTKHESRPFSCASTVGW